jgi:hypothetical protein
LPLPLLTFWQRYVSRIPNYGHPADSDREGHVER